MELADRLAGAVWGHLVGDAVGVPYEFKDPAQITSVHFGVSGIHHQPPGTWSDDGALMLALLDSLLRDRKAGEPVFDTADQAARFLAWRDGKGYTPDGDEVFDIGGATSAALARIRSGTPAETAGGTAVADNGNGSLMRILPLALVERDISDIELVDHAHRSSVITHGHLLSLAACALYVLVARNLLAGRSRADALLGARAVLRDAYHQRVDYPVRLETLGELEDWTGRSGRGFVVDSFWSAWDAFAGASSYRETIERAVRYGHDTDTTAAIAGGLAGIRFGRSGIPAHWLAKMRGAPIVDPLVARLISGVPAPVAATPTPAEAPPGSRTSATHPLRVDWVDLAATPGLAGTSGALGMTFLPGKHDMGVSGRHWRDLDADAARLRDHWHADVLVPLVEDHELEATGVTGISERLEAHGVELIRYPIVDQGVPIEMSTVRDLASDLVARIRAGQRVVVACRGGLGRTGTVVACVLRDAGLDAPDAIALVRKTRPGTIETAGQEAFVRAWVPAFVEPASVPTLPFVRYRGGGRELLGKPRQGDVTARHGYGPPVFAECGYACVYCGLDMGSTYEGWLQISVDHVVPRNSVGKGYPAEWVEDIANLVTCCRTCNEFGNQYAVGAAAPADLATFFDIRDTAFTARRARILDRHREERQWYESRGPGATAKPTDRTEQG